jgi:hypothetical protein
MRVLMTSVASQMLAAFRDHGADIKTYKNWDTRGGRWKNGHPDAYMLHNTATASAVGTSGCPTLYWAAHTYDWAISNVIIGRGPGDTYFLSANPSYHSGDGGPWPEIGIHSAANVGHMQIFGVEIDDPGRTTTLTSYQVENAARIGAALWDLYGWPDDKRIVTHQAWTDGSYGVNPNGPSPYRGRKGDTLHKNWSEYPGSNAIEFYNPNFWRAEAAKYRYNAKTRLWDGTIPKQEAIHRAVDNNLANMAVWRLAAHLYDLGYKLSPPANPGQQKYPARAVANIQAKWGWKPTGNYTERTHLRIWNKAK